MPEKPPSFGVVEMSPAEKAEKAKKEYLKLTQKYHTAQKKNFLSKEYELNQTFSGEKKIVINTDPKAIGDFLNLKDEGGKIKELCADYGNIFFVLQEKFTHFHQHLQNYGFRSAIIDLASVPNLKDDKDEPFLRKYYDAWVALIRDTPKEETNQILSQKIVSELRCQALCMANFFGKEKTFEFFEQSFIYLLSEAFKKADLKFSSQKQLAINPKIRKFYISIEEKTAKRIAKKNKSEEDRSNEKFKEFLEKVKQDIIEQIGPLYESLSEDAQQKRIKREMLERAQIIQRLAHGIEDVPADFKKQAQKFLQAFPDPTEFIDMVLDKDSKVWEQEQ